MAVTVIQFEVHWQVQLELQVEVVPLAERAADIKCKTKPLQPASASQASTTISSPGPTGAVTASGICGASGTRLRGTASGSSSQPASRMRPPAIGSPVCWTLSCRGRRRLGHDGPCQWRTPGHQPARARRTHRQEPRACTAQPQVRRSNAAPKGGAQIRMARRKQRGASVRAARPRPLAAKRGPAVSPAKAPFPCPPCLHVDESEAAVTRLAFLVCCLRCGCGRPASCLSRRATPGG